MDDIYINTIKDQIASGMYAHLFEGKRDLVFLDIGANIGLVSIYAVPYCKRIVAVEPAPDTFKTLQQNTRDYPMIDCVESALAPVCGIVDFYVNDINTTASSTVNTYGNLIKTQGVTLSGLAMHLDLGDAICKIDAEGAEGESLTLQELEWCKRIIKTYFIETHNCPKTCWEHKLGTLVGNFARCGYSKMSIDGMAITATRP